MKINVNAFWEHYYDQKKNKLIDNWQEGIRLLPFSSNPSSAVDKGAGIAGVTGAFFRLIGGEDVIPIEDSKATEAIVESYLKNQQNMDDHQAACFLDIMRDLLFINGTLNVTDVSILKYLPLVPVDEMIPDKTKKKYKSGQTKLVNLVYSLFDKCISFEDPDSKNLFTKLLREALASGGVGLGRTKTPDEKYFVLPFIQEAFNKDLRWLMSLDTSVIVRHIHLLLHFYICYEVLQCVSKLSYKKRDTGTPEPFYFILNSEKTSISHNAVKSWREKLPKTFLDKIFGYSQALDIHNSVLGGSIGLYEEILDKLNETPFDENKEACESLLRLYQEEKRAVFSCRSSESGSIDKIDTSVESYDDFLYKMEYLCKGLQSPSYVSRMRKKFIDLLSIRFLQLRRGNYILVLDNEMLVFLIAMITKGKRVKLENMYQMFSSYGIIFNRGTRMAIETYLLKLNLLDRKSDSGEAQYVKVIL